jgi:DNA-binding FrmR family transcriptional regulator
MAEAVQAEQTLQDATAAKAAARQGEKDVAPGCAACSGGTGTEGVAYKHTPRSDELKRDVTRRLNRAIGQLNGVKSMVEDGRYCGDVLTQLAAAESAIKAVSRIIMKDHLHTCVVERIQQGDTEVVDEIMDLLKKFGA